MPFIKIEKQNGSDFINIKKQRITISKSIYDKYFFPKNHISIFLDNDNKKIGLKPSDDGYSVYLTNNVREFKCAKLSNIMNGRFIPKWSDKHSMLLISYGENNNAEK